MEIKKNKAPALAVALALAYPGGIFNNSPWRSTGGASRGWVMTKKIKPRSGGIIITAKRNLVLRSCGSIWLPNFNH